MITNIYLFIKVFFFQYFLTNYPKITYFNNNIIPDKLYLLDHNYSVQAHPGLFFGESFNKL